MAKKIISRDDTIHVERNKVNFRSYILENWTLSEIKNILFEKKKLVKKSSINQREIEIENWLKKNVVKYNNPLIKNKK